MEVFLLKEQKIKSQTVESYNTAIFIHFVSVGTCSHSAAHLCIHNCKTQIGPVCARLISLLLSVSLSTYPATPAVQKTSVCVGCTLTVRRDFSCTSYVCSAFALQGNSVQGSLGFNFNFTN